MTALTILATIGGHGFDLLAGAGPAALVLALLPLLWLVIGMVLAEPGGRSLRWISIEIGPRPAGTTLTRSEWPAPRPSRPTRSVRHIAAALVAPLHGTPA